MYLFLYNFISLTKFSNTVLSQFNCLGFSGFFVTLNFPSPLVLGWGMDTTLVLSSICFTWIYWNIHYTFDKTHEHKKSFVTIDGWETSSSQLLMVDARAANLSNLAPFFKVLRSLSSSALNFSSVLCMGELSSLTLSSK